jgi:hypothetical protein
MASYKVVFIIDGIDKLNSSIRSSFLYRFNRIKNIAGGVRMRVLISSSNDENIERALRGYKGIDREKERKGE